LLIGPRGGFSNVLFTLSTINCMSALNPVTFLLISFLKPKTTATEIIIIARLDATTETAMRVTNPDWGEWLLKPVFLAIKKEKFNIAVDRFAYENKRLLINLA